MIKKIKIMSYPRDDLLAGYNLLDDNMYYQKQLDYFPRLKDKVLSHERKHQKHRFNFLYHIMIDLIDYPIILLCRDKYDYDNFKRKNYTDLPWYWGFGVFIYGFWSMIMAILLLIPMVFMKFFYFLSDCFSSEK